MHRVPGHNVSNGRRPKNAWPGPRARGQQRLTWQVGLEVDGELDGSYGAVVGRGAQDGPGVADVGDDHEVPLLDDGQRGAAALDGVEAAVASELVVDGGARGHVGLLPEVQLAVAELLLAAVDERRQRERLLPVAQQRRRQRVADGLGDVVAPRTVPVEDAAQDAVLTAPETLKVHDRKTMSASFLHTWGKTCEMKLLDLPKHSITVRIIEWVKIEAKLLRVLFTHGVCQQLM